MTRRNIGDRATRQFRHNDDNSPNMLNPEKGFEIAYDREIIDAVIRRALSEPAVPEPTETMLDAGAEAIENILFIGDPERPARIEARACFKAMIEAEDQDHD